MFGKAMVNVPIDFEDFDEDDPDFDIRKRRHRYWNTLKKLRHEYVSTYSIVEEQGPLQFLKWIEESYGFRPKLVDTYITDDFEIVDEQKYIMYILKYGQ